MTHVLQTAKISSVECVPGEIEKKMANDKLKYLNKISGSSIVVKIEHGGQTIRELAFF